MKTQCKVSFVAALVGICLFFACGSVFAAGTLRVANMGEPASLDPHKVSGTWENDIVGDMYIGLTTENQKAEPIPGVAEVERRPQTLLAVRWPGAVLVSPYFYSFGTAFLTCEIIA